MAPVNNSTASVEMSSYNLPELISLSEVEEMFLHHLSCLLSNIQASRTTTLLPSPSTPGSSRAMRGMWEDTGLISLNVAATQTEGTWKTPWSPHLQSFPSRLVSTIRDPSAMVLVLVRMLLTGYHPACPQGVP